MKTLVNQLFVWSRDPNRVTRARVTPSTPQPLYANLGTTLFAQAPCDLSKLFVI